MVTVVCLLTSVLAPAQARGGSELLAAPHLSRGQELVYVGSFTEEAIGRGTQFAHRYRLESRILVLDTTAPQTELAVLTSLRTRPLVPPGTAAPDSSLVRLEFARLTPQGRISLPSSAGGAPIEGPPTIECGAFFERPLKRAAIGKPWEVAEDGRPPRTWRILGTEMVGGTRCLKLVGLQQSDDWDRPRADRTAWQRRDTLWVALTNGLTYRVERIIERREPARRDPTERSVTDYSLETQVVFPGPLFENRRRELRQYRALADAAGPLLREPERAGRQAVDVLAARIVSYVEDNPATPYREAILQLKRRLETLERGDSVSVEASEEANPVTSKAALGLPAPDFLVSDLATRESVRLRRLLGQPVLLVFFAPGSKSCRELLQFAQEQFEAGSKKTRVLGLAVSDDAQLVARERQELKLTFPIAAGEGLRLTYGVDATPKIVLLDADGVVRGGYVGWGPEMPRLIADELRRCQKAPATDSSGKPGS